MSAYNGHKNYNHWNVSLWINNDEGLYNEARLSVRHTGNRTQAVERFISGLECMGITKTPDGAPYSVSAVRAAMVGM